jgi:hypothetical protein
LLSQKAVRVPKETSISAPSSSLFSNFSRTNINAALNGLLKFRLNLFARTVRQLHVPATLRTGKMLHSIGCVICREILVILEILGPIISMAARIVETTLLKIDKIAASQYQETENGLALITQRTLAT